MRGMQLFIQPQDLARATRAKVAAIGLAGEE
jgi:prolyl-tRNA editing enzyme YbaK/EbsC (Cys-tRNA(Pro) deacylase)